MTNGMKRALVIGTERMTRITNWVDRGTCILFGDGAGAAVLENTTGERGIISTYIRNYDDENEVMKCKANYVNPPFWEDDLTPRPLSMRGRAVFKFAVNAIEEVHWKKSDLHLTMWTGLFPIRQMEG